MALTSGEATENLLCSKFAATKPAVQRITRFGLFDNRLYSSFMSRTQDRNHVLKTALIDARRTVGLTQAEVAKRVGRPQSYVSKYERGERRLDVVEFVEICQAIGADPVRILDAIRSKNDSKNLAHRQRPNE